MSAMKRVCLLALVVLIAACEGPTDPGDPLEGRTGRLSGIVTIGPNCPVAQGNCPTPASAYSARKILVYNSTRSRLVNTVDIDSRGAYFIDLPATITYVIDFSGPSADRTPDLPKDVTVRAGTITSLNVKIDTGIR
jgi:hypothetical protein